MSDKSGKSDEFWKIESGMKLTHLAIESYYF